MCSETCPARALSFLNLPRKDQGAVETKDVGSGSSLHSNSSYEFEFGISAGGLEHVSSSADELFADGMILPIQIRRESLAVRRDSRSEAEAAVPLPFLIPIRSPPTCNDDDKKMERTEEIAVIPSRSGSDKEKLKSWSFWGFRRSTSLDSGDCGTKKSSVFPSQLLSRSKSTGSVPAPRRSPSRRRQASPVPKPPQPSSSYSSSSSTSSLAAKRASKSESEAAGPLPFLTPLPSPTTCNDDNEKRERTEDIAVPPSRSDSDQEKLQSWSFWGFRRSTSLNCGDCRTSKSSVFPSQFLTRSKSTGSVPARRRSSSRRRRASHVPRSSSYSSSTSHSYPWLQKTPSKKKTGLGAPYGSTVHVSPVLNLPTPCMSKGAANLFCLGCFTVKE